MTEAGGPEDLVHKAEVEGRAMLAIAENEIRESPSERDEVTRKGVGKPGLPVLFIGNDRTRQIGDYQADPGAGFQNTEACAQEGLQFIRIKVFEDVSGIDRLGAIRGIREASSQ